MTGHDASTNRLQLSTVNGLGLGALTGYGENKIHSVRPLVEGIPLQQHLLSVRTRGSAPRIPKSARTFTSLASSLMPTSRRANQVSSTSSCKVAQRYQPQASFQSKCQDGDAFGPCGLLLPGGHDVHHPDQPKQRIQHSDNLISLDIGVKIKPLCQLRELPQRHGHHLDMDLHYGMQTLRHVSRAAACGRSWSYAACA